MKEETQQHRPRLQKGEQKHKIIKDFGFLIEKKPLFINRYTAKYILEQGNDQIVDSYKQNPFQAIFSYIKYDYQGKIIQKVASGKITSDRAQKFREQILSMKIKQKAWFNICDQPIHTPHSIKQLLQDGVMFQDDLQPEDQPQIVSYDERTGFHYEMTLLKIQFRNTQNIEIKRKINEQHRQKGKIFFQQKKFYQAAKNFPKINPYSSQDIAELQSMNLSAKLNYVRCYFKIQEQWNQKELTDFTKQVIDYLLKKNSIDHRTHFYHARWLLKERFLENALNAAKKSNGIKRNAATDDLIEQIKNEIKNKGKIKVAVTG